MNLFGNNMGINLNKPIDFRNETKITSNKNFGKDKEIYT